MDARNVVRIYLERVGLSQNRLAAKAGLSISILSKFRGGQSITLETALRLLQAMAPDLTDEERETFEKETGISRYKPQFR